MDDQNPSPKLEDLPTHLILHILSFLPTLDAITTSRISRKFRPLWAQVPSLNFSFSQFPPYNSPPTTRNFFAQFVDRALLVRPSSPLLSFRLDFEYAHAFRCHVDSWLRYAVRNRTRDISLDFSVNEEIRWLKGVAPDIYDFPLFALREGEVETLALKLCDLSFSAAPMRLRFMKSVGLSRIFLTDGMVEDLVTCCPNLEELRVGNVCGLEEVRISAGKLKVLELRYLIRRENGLGLELDCPGLVELSFVQLELDRFVVKDLSSLEVFRVWFFGAYYGCWSVVVRMLDRLPNVKCLSVANWWFKLGPRDAFSRSFLLYNLEHLELQTVYTQSALLGLAELLELSPNVETLTLDHVLDDEDENFPEELLNKPITLNVPSLRVVKMKAYVGTKGEHDLLELLKTQGVVLEKIVIDYKDPDKPTTILRKRPPTTRVIQGFPSISGTAM